MTVSQQKLNTKDKKSKVHIKMQNPLLPSRSKTHL